MTETEWASITDPAMMLGFLRGKVSDRRLRLFACGCCQQVWHLMPEGQERGAVRTAERFADGSASPAEFDAARFVGNPHAMLLDDGAAVACFDPFDADAAILAAKVLSRRGGPNVGSLVRDIFGNPFRNVAADPAWLTADVTGLARAAYAGRAFGTLPILADALQDAGCDHAEVLAHCRGDGPHVRGCWVIDLLLGKS